MSNLNPADKPVQEGTHFHEEDPEYMTIEDDGQEAFDHMWEKGQTQTKDGYV